MGGGGEYSMTGSGGDVLFSVAECNQQFMKMHMIQTVKLLKPVLFTRRCIIAVCLYLMKCEEGKL